MLASRSIRTGSPLSFRVISIGRIRVGQSMKARPQASQFRNTALLERQAADACLCCASTICKKAKPAMVANRRGTPLPGRRRELAVEIGGLRVIARGKVIADQTRRPRLGGDDEGA